MKSVITAVLPLHLLPFKSLSDVCHCTTPEFLSRHHIPAASKDGRHRKNALAIWVEGRIKVGSTFCKKGRCLLELRIFFAYAGFMFYPYANMTRINRGMIYRGACLLAGPADEGEALNVWVVPHRTRHRGVSATRL
jgi:hypothetical protein